MLIPFIKIEGKNEGRVAWTAEGDVEDELRNYYNNEKVGVLDFVNSLKGIRASMYNAKQMNSQKKGD